MKQTYPLEKHILYEYDSFLIGNIKQNDGYYFRTKNEDEKEQYALILIRHMIEDYLKWSPQMARDSLSWDILKKWHLNRMAEAIRLPDDIDKSFDLFYIVHKIWPDAVPINAYEIYIQTYRRLILPIENHITKYPKDFFSGKSGMNKACACLKYALENFTNFTTVEDMYEFFGNKKKVSDFLKRYKLQLPATTFFISPIEYLEFTLHESQRDVFLSQYFNFTYCLEKGPKKIRDKKVSKSDT